MKIQKGDDKALEIFFRKYYQRIRIFVSKRIFNDNEIDDIVNEISLEIIKAFKSGKYDASKGSITQFIWEIANNQIKLYFKKIKDKQLEKDYKNMEVEKKLL